MDDGWIEVGDEAVNGEELMRRIHERLSDRKGLRDSADAEDPRSIADELRREMAGEQPEIEGETSIPMQPRDCDIVPSGYEIDWRVPIVGRLHAGIRRIINDEIRRYLMPSLEKQSAFNRHMLQVLEDLARENARLRQEIEALRGGQRE
jgi:hypothetical protein